MTKSATSSWTAYAGSAKLDLPKPKDSVKEARTVIKRDWWRGAVIYEVYVRSFCDSNGDGVGDLNGITSRLSYIKSLGVDAIWLTPFFASPMADFGYDVANYKDVDPLFGSLADFDHLMQSAGEFCLKVIIDLVLSHTSDRHEWFIESRTNRTSAKADWYVWADPKPDGTPPNNWLSVFGGSAWEWEPRRRQYYLHNFLRQQPDLNLHNLEVQDVLLDVATFWLERGVKGLRLDAANYYMHDPLLRDNPPLSKNVVSPAVNPYFQQHHLYDKSRPENLSFLRKLRKLLDRYPDAMAVAEIGDDEPLVRTAEYIQPDVVHTAYNFSFLTDHFSPNYLSSTIKQFEVASPKGWPSWTFSNHDASRVLSRWGAYNPSPEQANPTFSTRG